MRRTDRDDFERNHRGLGRGVSCDPVLAVVGTWRRCFWIERGVQVSTSLASRLRHIRSVFGAFEPSRRRLFMTCHTCSIARSLQCPFRFAFSGPGCTTSAWSNCKRENPF